MPRTPIVFVTVLAIVFTQSCVHAALLRPSDFSTIGEFSSVAGSYVLDTDSLTLSGPQENQVLGILSDGVAVFAFDRFVLASGANLVTVGSRPAAILSLTDIAVGGSGIRVHSGGGQGGEPRMRGEGLGGGFPGFAFFGGAGGGGGFGRAGGRGQLTSTFHFPGDGGPDYGNLEESLLGGSGGGGSKDSTGFQSAGGNGGGALELGALQSIEIFSLVVADGQEGQRRGFNHTGGGGGSGGGLILHAPAIVNLGAISANGGRGGAGVFKKGGGGGGGRILVDTAVSGFTNLGTLSVSGGTSPSDFFGTGTPGRPGIITVRSTIVPEPSSCFLAIFALLGAGCNCREF